MKAILKYFLVAVLALLVVGTAYAQADHLQIKYLKINGEEFDATDSGSVESLRVKRGEDIDIKIKVFAEANVEDIQAEADIYGYRYSDHEGDLVSDTSEIFDLDENDTDYITLHLKVPTKMDREYAKLRIRVADDNGPVVDKDYQLHIVGIDDEDAIMIKDYSFSPSYEVISGRAFTAMVQVRNIGDERLDDVKVTVSVPELNIQDSEYMDDIGADDSEVFEELLLRVPSCAESGTYEVEIEVEFDEYESTMVTDTIRVVQDDTCTAGPTQVEDEKTVITVPSAQDAKAGATVVYPITVGNTGTKTKSYTFTTSGVDALGDVRMDPSSVVLVDAGDTETVYLYLDIDKNANEGNTVFVVNVLSSDGESKQIPLTASVSGKAAGESTSLLKGLQIGLIVLVIILIIIGLIIGFNKLRKEDEPEDETQTYY